MHSPNLLWVLWVLAAKLQCLVDDKQSLEARLEEALVQAAASKAAAAKSGTAQAALQQALDNANTQLAATKQEALEAKGRADTVQADLLTARNTCTTEVQVWQHKLCGVQQAHAVLSCVAPACVCRCADIHAPLKYRRPACRHTPTLQRSCNCS